MSNMRDTRNTTRGQSLMEILFAIAIFIIGVVTVGYLVIDARVSLLKNIEYTEARLLAREGIEALRIIRDQDFASLEAGEHSLTLEDGGWSLSADEESIGKFTRSLTIEEIDEDIVHVASSIVWEDIRKREQTLALDARLTNWRGEHADALLLHVDVSGVTLPDPFTQLMGTTLQNIGGASDTVTITDVTVMWDTPQLLRQILVDGVLVYEAETGTGSGTQIDVTDFVLTPETAPSAIDFLFDGDMQGSDFTLTFFTEDGSSIDESITF